MAITLLEPFNLNPNSSYTLGNLTVSGNTTVTNANLGNLVTANYFSGNGSLLTAIAGANVTGTVANATYATSAGSSTTAGTVTTAAQPNITSVGTLASLVVTANANVGNINTTDAVISGNATITGNLTVSGTTEYTNVTNLYVKDPIIEMGGGVNGAPLTSNDGKDRGTLLHYYSSSAIDAFMGWDNSNAEFAFGSNVTVASEVVTFNNFGNVRAGYFIGNGSQLTGISSAAYANYIANGTSNVNIATSSGNITVGVSGNANIVTVTGTGVNIAGTLNVTGNANVGNIGATNGVFTNVSGNGSALSSITGGNVTGQVGNALIAGTVYTAAQPNITSTGTLTSLTVTGNVSSGNANLGNLTTSNYFAGTLTTGAQPNITSTGTLSSLTVGPNSSIVLSGTTGYLKANTIQGRDGVTGITLYYSNVSGAIGVETNLTVGASGTGNVIVNGNITSTNANLGNLVTANYTTAVLTTGAQPNITSTGTLTSLIVTGNVSSGNANLGNLTTSNYYSGVLTTAAQPNITSVGSLTGLTVSNATGVVNFATTANVTLGAVSNLHISGGTNGYVLSTDGAGTLSWVAQSGGGGGGAANISIYDEGNLLTNAVASINFVGSGVTATNTGNAVTVTISTSSGSGGGSYVTRTYTGNGVQNTFTVTSGVTASSILVMENGIVQVPTTDYSVSGANLTFTTAPANGMAIQVRELSSGISAQDLLSPFLLMGA